jgi:pyruvate dehydrogenase E1 component
VPYFQQQLQDEPWPIVVTSDYVSSIAERLTPWAPASMCILSTDGFGRSDARADLRHHFEIDSSHVVFGALSELVRAGKFDADRLGKAIEELNIDPEKLDPALA